jgi:hypothetical protein
VIRYLTALIVTVFALVGCQSATTSSGMAGTAAPTMETPAAGRASSKGKDIPSSASEVPRITPQELWALTQAGERVVIIDTRSQDAYEQSHIPGAGNMPPSEIEIRYRELPREVPIVLYCT